MINFQVSLNLLKEKELLKGLFKMIWIKYTHHV